MEHATTATHQEEACRRCAQAEEQQPFHGWQPHGCNTNLRGSGLVLHYWALAILQSSLWDDASERAVLACFGTLILAYASGLRPTAGRASNLNLFQTQRQPGFYSF